MTKSIFERMGLVENEVPAVPQEDDAPAHSFSAPALPLGTAPQSAPISLAPFAVQGGPLSPADQQQLDSLRAQVYAIPSTYTTFQKLREALGNTTDLAQVFRIFAAANPGVTAQKVAADIDAHLGVIASERAEFNAQINQARADRIDAPSRAIADLQADSARLQQQMRLNSDKVTDLQKNLADAQRAITDGAARFKAIEDTLSAPLVQAKQLLGSLT
jgi:chromosome segregation ATPase